MRVPQLAVVLSTVALATALARFPEHTPREQQVFEYFPDYRYVDPMENPSFMTAECTSEGVFPHPYNCTWFYRCHDRTGHGFFTTNWFYCEPGTEFDDDLDQCIPKSGTCGDGKDTHFCRTLSSSCRSCNVGSSQQELCEFKECYNGGRDAGIQRICEHGQMFSEQSRSCVEDGGCSPVPIPPSECPLNKMRPAAKWTDEASGCTVHTGCRAGRNYEERLCTRFYDCQQGTKVLRSCPDGYFFSPQWELCIQPPQQDCTAPPTPPARCIVSQGDGQDCQEVTGCFNGNPVRTTRRLCNHYTCPQTGTKKFYCQGPGSSYSFSPDSKTCISNLVTCPVPECLPENAVRWENCDFYTGYRYPSPQKISQEQLCQVYSCSFTNGLRPCGPGQLFEPKSKTCIIELTPFPQPPTPCSANLATLWESCATVSGCSDDGIQKTMEECQIFKCSANGKASNCPIGQVFSPTLKACITPLSVVSCPCTVNRAKFWGDCKDVTGCSTNNPSERTENQCQTYQCSISGQQLRCESGKVFSPDQRSCVEPLNVASCPCTVNRAKFWGDCKDVTGCSTNNPSERTENQCHRYQCSNTGPNFRCESGKVFSPDQRSCVEPLNVASCPCTVNRAKFWGDCKDVTGCSANNPSNRTENQCHTYQCSNTGPNFRCESGKVFSPDQRSCVEPLNDSACPAAPEICTPEKAQKWTTCQDFCNDDGSQKHQMCFYFSCTGNLDDDRVPCSDAVDDQGTPLEAFDPRTKTCKPKGNACTRAASSVFREGCSPDIAQLWFDCSINEACIADHSPLQQQSLCRQYLCEAEKFSCSNGQMYDSEKSACVPPLTGKYCLTGIPNQQPKVTFKSWNNQWN